MKRSTLSRALALALVGAAAPAFAITDVENNASIPFSFSNPGARSLGMGGAFIGLADDATAAYTNPAGLTGLGFEKQFSIEVRHNEFDSEYVTGGTATTGAFDRSGLVYSDASDSSTPVSFLSFVWPSETWSMAVYRHQLVDYQNSFRSDAILFDVPQFSDAFFVFPVDAETDLEIVNFGFSLGFRLSDRLSAGAGVSFYDFDIDTVSRRFDADVPGAPDTAVNVQTQRGSDEDFGFNLGVLFRASDRFQIGATYRTSVEFEYRHVSVAGAGNTAVAPGTVFVDRMTSFETPDVFGVGVAWRPTDAMTVTLDVSHIGYSNLTDEVDSAFFTDAQLTPELVAVLDRLEIDDAIEPRLGFEYVLLNMERPLSLRAGIWREERHTIQFEGDPTAFDGDLTALAQATADAILFSTGDDEMHYSIGLGWAFKSFQLDFAADFSDIQDTYSVSGVWRF